MPDVQEVFRMATQKVGPSRGARSAATRQRRQVATRRKAAVRWPWWRYSMVVGLVVGISTLRERRQRQTGNRVHPTP